jgi:hypothetical protein
MREIMKKPRLRPPQGFTLMELFITLIVCASTFVAFVTLFYALNNYSKKSYQLLVASDLAYAKLQSYEQKNFHEVANGNGSLNYKIEDFSSEIPETVGADRTGEVFVLPVSDNPRLKKIDVIVKYKIGRDEKLVHYASILQETEQQ